jgi:hypothetical protein
MLLAERLKQREAENLNPLRQGEGCLIPTARASSTAPHRADTSKEQLA